ncbi:MAG: hypothetical protein Q7T55_16740 [Solirubrobacteraceae bacterium]|nr:hypothetical protein [Solirubrobacteraceae bacterium]
MPLRKNGTLIGRAVAITGLSVAALALPSGASAATTTTASCPTQPATTKAFAKIGDNADYSLAPNGSFENGSTGWTLSNAKLVNGNETVGILGGLKSIALGGGIISGQASVVSPEFCVDQSHPYFRFLLKANGPVGLMNIGVQYTDEAGTLKTQSVQSNVATNLLPGKWKASELNPLSLNIPLVNDGGQTAKVRLVFSSPMSLLGFSYNIDNVLVDPYRRG